MLMTTEEVWEGLYYEPGLGSDLDEAVSIDRHYGAGSYVEFMKHYQSEPDYPTSNCPRHGEQEVVRSYSTRGPDPYSIEVLACGAHVMGFSADDVFFVKECEA